MFSITPPSYEGFKWGILFTDDCYRVRWVRFFAQKREAHTKLVQFSQFVETQYQKVIRTICLDGGQEYGGDKLQKFALDNGVVTQLTVPYTPEQDGVAERGIRTLLDKARTIIHDQAIPYKL